MIGNFLVSVLVAICIASIVNCINIALAQYKQNTPFNPSTGQSPSSLSPPSPSTSSPPPPFPSARHPANAENGTIIAPPRPNTVDHSSITASPIT